VPREGRTWRVSGREGVKPRRRVHCKVAHELDRPLLGTDLQRALCYVMLCYVIVLLCYLQRAMGRGVCEQRAAASRM
jgi:hypothetical protein